MKKLDLKYKFEDFIYFLYNIQKSIKYSLSNNPARYTNKNISLKGKHSGKRCFVIGNGPSIGAQPLERLGHEHTFVCNYFYKHPKIAAINPNYYFIVDDKIRTGEWPISMLDDIEDRCPDAKIFLSSGPGHHPKVMEIEARRGLNWITGGKLIYPGFRYPIDLTRPIGGDNVVKIALQAAIYMGFTEIYILGVDGDGLFRDLLGQSSHFYQAEAENAAMDPRRMELDLWFCTEGFRSWRAIAERFADGPVRIYNATPGGLLNVFPRRSLEAVLAQTEPRPAP
ncbi:MAG: DUF115 domain-containing protein [Alphaproteobacteria bacterium]|nr:DUF115 domain-containing protein [Alphaproteobacteria bacterium]MBU2378743.1 DUF115 domain-containing protein [Alphaproteobacteria bacterium]